MFIVEMACFVGCIFGAFVLARAAGKLLRAGIDILDGWWNKVCK